jgi:SAM-dependent methyltransferase
VRAAKIIRVLERRFFPERSRNRLQREWEKRWSREDSRLPWMGRSTSKQILEAVETGWFPAGGLVLDIGCGLGEVTHWFAERGFSALGVDFASAAIERARSRYAEIPGRLEYRTLDIVRETPPDRPYSALLDRGCFHSIPRVDSDAYVRNVASASAHGTPLLLFIRAFRGRLDLGHREEREFHDRSISDSFSRDFEILRSDEAALSDPGEDDLEEGLPGLVYWMRRR